MPAPLRFAHFEVLTRSDGSPHLLGHGAMGATFKALDQNLLSLAVVKVPSVELLSNPAARQRFLQEAQMMARLRHPHVASVFYYGDSASGPFYAMEFCDGPSLHDYIAHHGPLEPEDTFRLALQTATALQALDAHELVHRDLKPSNIILTTDSGGGAHVKLIDFGVAREGLPADTGGLTLGGFIGTPAFASPEQLLEASHLDSRSDLYSLGAVMWFCLTGHPPFEGSQFEIMFHHVNTEPLWSELPPMSGAALTMFKRLLAKSAEERYASPAALVNALQQLLGIAAPASHSMLLRTSIYEKDRAGLSGYETLLSLSNDEFGRVWKACDVLTGRIVSMRELPAEFAQKQGLILRLQRLTAVLRPLDHPRWQRIWHFEQSGAECRLATELIEGPTALHLLKVHQQLPLAYVLPLLTQIVEAMDAAASEGLTAVETAPERLPIAVGGWTQMTEQEQSALLRKPLAEWPSWSVKICPLRLSNAIQDYVLPSDSQAAQALTRISSDFIQLCYRLLTGQGKTASAYVPSPALTVESNAFFERHFSTQRSSSPQTCHTLLRQLCLAEGVPAPASSENESLDPFATRVVTRQRTLGPTRKRPATSIPATSAADAPTLAAAPRSSMAASEAPTVITRAPASFSIEAGRLEQRRAQLEADATQLKEAERLQAERDWIARERVAIEMAKQKVAENEHERVQHLAEEQARLAEQKKQIELQQAKLEDKRREQERLEQEIQLRAQLDFQKLQEEARERESDLQRQRAAVEQALREREREFQQREKASLERLKQLKQETDVLEEEVEQEYLTVRRIEDDQARRLEEEAAAEAKARAVLAAEEKNLLKFQQETERRRQQPPKRVAKKNSPIPALLITGVVIVAVFAAGIYLFKDSIQQRFSNARQFTGLFKSAAVKAREKAKNEQRWGDFLVLCVNDQASLRQSSEDAATDELTQVHADANAAISHLLGAPDLWPAVEDPQRHHWIQQLEAMKGWPVSSNLQTLVAKLRIPLALSRQQPAAAFEDYIAAIAANPQALASLEPEAKSIAPHSGQYLADHDDIPTDRWVTTLTSATKGGSDTGVMGYDVLLGQLHLHQALQEGPLTALKLFIRMAGQFQHDPTHFKPLVAVTFARLSDLPMEEQASERAAIQSAAENMNLPDAWLTLAKLEPDEVKKRALYQKAEQGGSLKALGWMGSTLVDQGLKENKPELMDQGIAKLRQAAATGDMENLLQLASALCADRGNARGPEDAIKDAEEALDIVKKALTEKHAGAAFVAGKAHLRLGQLNHDADAYLQAIQYLQQAADQQTPGVYHLLYLANYNNTFNKTENAAKALQAGAEAMEPACLYDLGVWYYAGRPPIKIDPVRGHQLISQAAKLDYEPAKKWLQMYPAP